MENIMKRIVRHTSECVHGTRPPCSCACPANLDLRTMMKKVAVGNFNSAYRILADQLLFPEIANRLCLGNCMSSCAENLDIKRIERICIENATRKNPIKYSVAPKKERIAIVGAGISGLTCALWMSRRGYSVVLFDALDEVGGTLLSMPEKEIFQKDIELQYKFTPYTFVGGKKISSAEELIDYDAVYIATGKDGYDFGLMDGHDNDSMATKKKGWFLGGELCGGGKLEALAQGRVAAVSMEKYLLSGNMGGAQETFIQRVCLFDVPNSGAKGETPGINPSPDWAKREAARCKKCDCTICYDHCEFMQGLGMFPAEIEELAIASTNPDVSLVEQQGSRMVFTCSACGHCGSVCPKGISLEKLFIDAKQELKLMGKFPDVLHSYYIDDMNNANGENALLYYPHENHPEFLFFPGCQAMSSNPSHITAAYDYITKHFTNTALMLGCCGVPALWSGAVELFKETIKKFQMDWERLGKPTLILMCPTCMKTFAKYLPEIPLVSLYEIIVEQGVPDTRVLQKSTFAIFDPCSSRDFPNMQAAVRKLARAITDEIQELPQGRDTARCCGTGGQIYASKKKLAQNMTKSAAELSNVPYITYCENCRNVFIREGKACRHILDDLFGLIPLERVPHIHEMKWNRKKLKQTLMGDETCDMGELCMKVEISPELFDKMDQALISLEDVYAAISHCEKDGGRLKGHVEDSFIGYLKIGYVTYWVEYKRLEENSFKLINTYCHRLTIGGKNEVR